MISNTVWQTLEMYWNNPIYWYECKDGGLSSKWSKSMTWKHYILNHGW